MTTDRKNISLTLSMDEYDALNEIKEDLDLRSFTRVILYLYEFYIENKIIVKNFSKEAISLVEDVANLKDRLSKIEGEIISQEDIFFMKNNLNLVMQNISSLNSTIQNKAILNFENEIKSINSQLQDLKNSINSIINSELSKGKVALEENEHIKNLLRKAEGL